MSTWSVEVGEQVTAVRTDGYELLAPVGARLLSEATLLGDPPRPEELTNAIGAMVDHLDDVVRERPDVIGAEVCVSGPEVLAIAAVELGHDAPLPIELGREAIEDVFRTLATERATDRRHNPGLPGALVGTVVAGCCILVALMRRLHLDSITVVGGTA